jgi:spermidine synthase
LAVVAVGYAASGCAALVYEIAWTRVLSLVIGSSVYAFSMMLTAFILGLALGSVICARFVDRVADPMRVLAVIQVSIGLSAALVVPLLGRLPLGLTGVIARASASFWQLQAIEFLVILAIMIVPTTLMGAAFPLAMRLVVHDVQRTGRSVGTLYAFNTVGSIVGAFAGGFVLIPLLGIQRTLLTAVFLNVAAGCVFLAASQSFAPARRGLAVALVVAAAVTLAVVIPPWDPLLMTFGPFIQARRLAPEVLGSRRELERLANRPKVIFHEEDYATTVTVKEYPNAVRVISVNAKPDASSTGDLPTQQLLAHVPLLLHPDPKSALVIGLASGITMGSAGLHPLDTLDCAEISPSMTRACRLFDDYNHRILDDPRVTLYTADGRNHLALTSRKYDVIISEPSNPWIAGIGDLFTEEFFQLCRHRLTDQGIACIWLETYNIDLASFQSVVSTFGAVFPEMTIWSTTPADVLLVGSKDHIRLDYETLADRIDRQSIKSDVARIGIESAADFLGFLMMRGEGAMRLAAGAPIHTDDNALLEFAAPRVLVRNVDESATVDALVEHRDADRTFEVGPDDIERVRKIKDDAARNVRAKGHILRSRAHTRAQRHAEAIGELRAAARLNRSDEWLKDLLDEGLGRANALVGRQQYAEAASTLRELLSVDPNLPGALNGLALLLATNPNPVSRNAAEAVRMAERLCEETGDGNADYLHTLSIAYGAAGRAQDAANRARQALGIAQQTGNEALAKTLRTKLEQFERYRSRGAN